ncbi:MAG: sulfite exporter TauE/SafE family protein [Armatimonadetes bacterium]|nr:sulfite exporter TauE/SafE family protein [Armatimonadota bacterium]
MAVGNLSIFTAFIGGLITFISPCVLPLIPAYLSFISGVSIDEMRYLEDKKQITHRVILNSLLFIAGFTLIFIILGASASYFGKLLLKHRDIIEKVGGTLVIFFGLHTMGVFNIKFLNYEKTLKVKQTSRGLVKSFLMGLAFAAGWTPCISPVLSAILILAAKQNSMPQGMSLLFVYSLGFSIPFFLAGMGINIFFVFFNKIKKYFRAIEICAGILLIFLGILIFTDNINLQSLLDKFSCISIYLS